MNEPTIKIEKPSEKSFAMVFGILFLFTSGFFYKDSHLIGLSFFIIAIMIFLTGFFKPSYLKKANLYWFKFGLLLGGIISPIVMAVIYFLIIFPTGILLKLFNKDPLLKKINKSKSSYWITRKTSLQPFKNQF